MIFPTTINDIHCLCEVLNHSPARPMQIHGSGFGDAHPPEPEEFEFQILDLEYERSTELESQVSPSMKQQLLEEYRVMKDAEYYAFDA